MEKLIFKFISDILQHELYKLGSERHGRNCHAHLPRNTCLTFLWYFSSNFICARKMYKLTTFVITRSVVIYQLSWVYVTNCWNIHYGLSELKLKSKFFWILKSDTICRHSFYHCNVKVSTFPINIFFLFCVYPFTGIILIGRFLFMTAFL